MIYIYSVSPAVDLDCVDEVFNRLTEFGVDPQSIERLETDDALGRALDNQQGILILPGGNAAFIQWHFNSNGLTDKVIAAVANGWNCLGFCAGASVLCKDVLLYQGNKAPYFFRDYGALPTVLPHVHAHVPYFPVNAFSGSGVDNGRLVFLQTHKGKRFQTYWNEGGYFKS